MSTPKPKATRNNGGKPKLSMILDASEALYGAAQVLEFGEKKYARGNWLKGLDTVEIMDSLLRHLVAYNSGENRDEESGLPHVDHVLVNALFLAQMYRYGASFDGRTVQPPMTFKADEPKPLPEITLPDMLGSPPFPEELRRPRPPKPVLPSSLELRDIL